MILMLLNRKGWTSMMKDKVTIMGVADKKGILPTLKAGPAIYGQALQVCKRVPTSEASL